MPDWQVEALGLGEAALLRPPRHTDHRGSLVELWNADRLPNQPIPRTWSQVNLTESVPGSLRGLHLQHPAAQHKMVRVLAGRIWDVVVNLRPDSPTRRQWRARWLTAKGGEQLYVPTGFAHGFCVPNDEVTATVLYMMNTPYRPNDGRVLRWDSPELALPWPVQSPILSPQDSTGLDLPLLESILSKTS